jgi:hypothetical protein
MFMFFRMFVGTWNVGGRAPHGGLDLFDWLIDGPASSSPHIYVLGYVSVLVYSYIPALFISEDEHALV